MSGCAPIPSCARACVSGALRSHLSRWLAAQESFRALHAAGSYQRYRAPAMHRRSAHAANKAPKPQRSAARKPEKPPPPTDDELIGLPQGLCKRYQQARCHKGRSCKWKHEIWPTLQERWDEWHRLREAEPAADTPAESPAACSALPGSSSAGAFASALTELESLVPAEGLSEAGLLLDRARDSPEAGAAAPSATWAAAPGESPAPASGRLEASVEASMPPAELPGESPLLPIPGAHSGVPGFANDFGVPQRLVKELARGPAAVLEMVWSHWRSKRSRRADGLPLLATLRRDAVEVPTQPPLTFRGDIAPLLRADEHAACTFFGFKENLAAVADAAAAGAIAARADRATGEAQISNCHDATGSDGTCRCPPAHLVLQPHRPALRSSAQCVLLAVAGGF